MERKWKENGKKMGIIWEDLYLCIMSDYHFFIEPLDEGYVVTASGKDKPPKKIALTANSAVKFLFEKLIETELKPLFEKEVSNVVLTIEVHKDV